MSVRPAGLIAPLIAVVLVAACTGGTASRTHQSARSSRSPSLPTCPYVGGDAAFGPPTLITPADRDLRGRIGVLASTRPAHGVTVRAVVSGLSKTHTDVAIVVRSRIVLTRQAFENVPGARGVPDLPFSRDQLLLPSNVIATSRVVRTTDLADHALTLTVPAGLPPRDYFVIGVQDATQQCQPSPRTGTTEAVIGLVRVLTRYGRVFVLKPPPSHAH